MSIDLATKGDSWEVMDTRPQTEHECGIRMVMYMIRLKEWAMVAQNKSYNIAMKMKWFISDEKKRNGDLAAQYRKELYSILKKEQKEIGG